MKKVSGYAIAAVMACVLSSCTDQSDPSSEQSPPAPSLAAGGQGGGNGPSSLDLIEADFGDGLLDRENANRYRQYAVSAPAKLPSKYRSTAVGKDATYSMLLMARDWDRLSSATRQEILDIRRNGYGNLSDTVVTEHFVLHYTRQGNNAVPARDANGNRVPDFIDVAAESWEHVWDREIEQLKYPAPKGTPQNKFHVYYRDFFYYGVTYAENVELESVGEVPLGTASGYIEVENDFYGFPPNDEDAVYDDINDWHYYIDRFLSRPELPLFNRYVYGSAYFMNYLSETYGIDAPRLVWMAGQTRTTANAVKQAGFGGSWENMKLFAPAEYLLGISDFTTDPVSSIRLPVNHIRVTHEEYPVDVTVPASTNKVANGAPWGLGANFIQFDAGANKGTLRLTFEGSGAVAWRPMVALIPDGRQGSPTVIPMPLTGPLDVSGFGTRWSRVVLMPTIADQAGVEVPYAYGAVLR